VTSWLRAGGWADLSDWWWLVKLLELVTAKLEFSKAWLEGSKMAKG